MNYLNGFVRTGGLTFLLLIALANPAASETVKVDGHEVYHEAHGNLASGKTPILLLHGGMMSIDMTFADLMPLLGKDHPVIAIEQQGHGHTADRENAITLESMRRDTLGVLDHLGIRQVHVVGFSMGGMLGLEMAVNAPDRIASLSAISASADVEGMIPAIVKMNRDPNFKPSPEIAQRMPTQADFRQMQAAFANNPSGPGTFNAVMEKLSRLIVSDWGWSDAELATIRAPVLLAIGDRDFILPTHAVEMAKTIPDAQLAILPDATHMTILEHTEWIVPMIEQRIATATKSK